ncbi:MAG: HAD family hydrolase [Ignavibacteria bacterium]|nr:HAD family hydrolase [Ignavibacteria bacterium]
MYLEELVKVRVVAFDKTGTLTVGKPRVHDVIAFNGRTANDVVTLAASVEQFSQHPLAQSIVDEAKQRGCALRPVTRFQSHIGQGVSAEVDGQILLVGSPEWCIASGSMETEPMNLRIDSLRMEGKTIAIIASDGVAFGIIAVRDGIRPNAIESPGRAAKGRNRAHRDAHG